MNRRSSPHWVSARLNDGVVETSAFNIYVRRNRAGNERYRCRTLPYATTLGRARYKVTANALGANGYRLAGYLNVTILKDGPINCRARQEIGLGNPAAFAVVNLLQIGGRVLGVTRSNLTKPFTLRICPVEHN